MRAHIAEEQRMPIGRRFDDEFGADVAGSAAAFSITTGWPHISFSFCPITRPSMSVVPPAGHGTIRRTGLADSFAHMPG